MEMAMRANEALFHDPLAPARRNNRVDGTAMPPNPPPQVERLVSLFSGRRYVFFSIAATAVAVASTYHSVLTTQKELQAATTDGEASEMMASGVVPLFVQQLRDSRLSSLIVIHFYFVVLYHVFLGVTRMCFGVIRRPEIEQTKETILNFMLMRSLLLASTIGTAQDKPSLGLLVMWLSAVAFLRGILSICNARFDYLLTRPMTRAVEFHRLALMLVAIMATDVGVAAISTVAGVFSTTVVHLTWFEASLFLIKASQLGTKVVFHVFDLGNVAENGLEKGELYLLLLQTTLSGAHLVQLVVYYLYIISVDHFRVSFLDFILILNVKTATVELLEKIKQVQAYQQVVLELDQLFPDATTEELDAVRDDVCVICLKPMDTHAKKLQCGHLFHRFCLRQCLQKASVGDAFATIDPNGRRQGVAAPAAGRSGAPAGTRPGFASFRCPLCRKTVSPEKIPEPVSPVAQEEVAAPDEEQRGPAGGGSEDAVQPVPAAEEQPPQLVAQVPPRENVLRISTEFLSRWIPFVPHLSFEIVRPPTAAPFVINDEMVHRVLDVFPQFSPETIRRDLTRTRSPERTIERILSGRLQEDHDEMDGDGLRDGAPPDLLDDDLRWDMTLLWDALWGNPRDLAAPPQTPHQRQRAAQPGAPAHPDLHR